jgi:hypothetical protein
MREAARLIEDHQPSLFGPSHCRPCARPASGTTMDAIWALGLSGTGILLAVPAFLTG